MTSKEQAMLKLPYIQTSFMVNELINLDHEIKGTNIKIIEKPGMRKDRFSALEYNFKICTDLAVKLKPKNTDFDITKMVGVSKRPKKWGFYN